MSDLGEWPETIEQAALRIGAEIDAACPGECNKQWRKASRRALRDLERSNTTGEPLDARIMGHPLTAEPGAPVWCAACAAEVLSGLSRLPDLAAACGRRKDGRLAPPPPSERHALAVAPPSPSPAYDQVEAIVAFAAGWADQLARHLEHDDPALYRLDGFRGPTLTRSVAFLIHRRSALLSAPFARTFGTALLSLVHRCTMVGGVDPLVHELAEPCYTCKRRGLSRRDGQDYVICSYCGRRWPWGQFQWLAQHVIAEPRGRHLRVVRADDPPPTATIVQTEPRGECADA